MDRGAWRATVHRVTRVRLDLTTDLTTKQQQRQVIDLDVQQINYIPVFIEKGLEK